MLMDSMFRFGKQYVNYWRGILHGDMGKSLRLNQNVGHDHRRRPTPTPWSSRWRRSWLRWACRFPPEYARRCGAIAGTIALLSFVSLLGLSFPNFALGPILILFFAIELGWLPVSGAGSPAHLDLAGDHHGRSTGGDPHAHGAHLDAGGAGTGLHSHRARQRLCPSDTVVYRHALRNAMIPILTVVGLQFGALLAGAIVTETIFSWPGIGRLTITAISNRDYYLVQGCILMIGLTYVLVNFLTDLLYSAFNPRIRQ